MSYFGGGEECNNLIKDPGLESAMHNFEPESMWIGGKVCVCVGGGNAIIS